MDLKEFIETYTQKYGRGIVKELCEYIGKDRQFIYSVKHKRFNPSLSVAHKICDFTHGLVQVHEIRRCTTNCAPGCACSKGRNEENIVKIKCDVEKNPR